MKLLLIGTGRSGKDSLCEYVRDIYGLSYKGSSEIACEKVIYPQLKDRYNSIEECMADRHNGDNRTLWFKLISEYNTPDKSRLVREVLSEYDLYSGLRCKEEFEASKHLFDLIIWVDAEERLGVTEDSSSITITKDDADIIIENNADLNTFKGKITRLFDTWYADRKTLEKRKADFGKEVEKFIPKYGRDLCLQFWVYWTEHSPKGRKMRYEKQKTFDISRRLATFAKNEKKFSIANMLKRKE